MPEINPLTNNQIFLKKIAENTGSNYEAGDVSEINPLTIDQIFLKEIAANTAGQSGDITELERKVADNTGAIEAIVNENGCCNILQNNLTTRDFGGADLTVNADKSITIDGTPNVNNPQVALCDDYTLKAGTYTLSTGLATNSNLYMYIFDVTHTTALGITYQEEGGKATFTLSSDSVVRPLLAIFATSTISNETVYPMLYDARLNPTGYVPYSMTNRELTEKVITIEYKELTSDYNGWINVPYDGRTIITTIGSGGDYGLVRDFDENHTNQKIQLYACNPTNDTWNVARNETVTLGLVYLKD